MANPLRTLLGLSFLCVACATKTAPLVTDGGTELTADPYNHQENPQYTSGRMAGFRSLYVDPKTYVDGLTPTKPPPTSPFQPHDGPALPQDLTPALLVKADLTRLSAQSSFDDLLSAITKDRTGITVAMPSEGLVLFSAPETGKKLDRLTQKLHTMSFSMGPGGVPIQIQDVASIAVVDTLPKPIQAGRIMQSPEGEETFVVTVVPIPPPPTYPAKGTLHLRNTSTAWSEVRINGAKVGVIGPLGHATLTDVKTGFYTVDYTLPNGFNWAEEASTDSLK